MHAAQLLAELVEYAIGSVTELRCLRMARQVGAPAGSPADDTLASSVLSILGPVFCLPVNKTLLARWDRVEDRLWKLHHCLDLDGVRRDLALFAPELAALGGDFAGSLALDARHVGTREQPGGDN